MTPLDSAMRLDQTKDEATHAQSSIRRGVSRSTDAKLAATELFEQIQQDRMVLVVFFVAASYDLKALEGEMSRLFEGQQVIGCTTGGEITPDGYIDDSITGLSLGADDFKVETLLLDHVSKFQMSEAHEATGNLAEALGGRGEKPSGRNTFAFLLIDGLCRQEEVVASALSQTLGDIQMFGGSAADGTRFERTRVYHDGRFHDDAAVLTLVQTALPFEIFKTQHFEQTNVRMVVTKADAPSRTVLEINGLPAGPEYARLVGLDPDTLSETIFAGHPVVVRLGGDVYVRSIMKVNEDQSLTFACAIDEGIVFTMAQATGLVANIAAKFADVEKKLGGPPQLTIGCDCLFRKIETSEKDLFDELTPVLTKNNVIGFATYGEQFNSMHINQTFTGVAIGSR